jgi:hypothetical protein
MLKDTHLLKDTHRSRSDFTKFLRNLSIHLVFVLVVQLILALKAFIFVHLI